MDINNIKAKVQISEFSGGEPMRVCPHCGKKKPLSDFGFRNMGNGDIRNQSWCKECRKH